MILIVLLRVGQDNPYIGKGVSVSNYELIRALEEITGRTIINEYDLPPDQIRDWNADQIILLEQEEKIRQKALDYQEFLLRQISIYQSMQTLSDNDNSHLELLQN